jgi:MFS family permease
MHKDDRPGGGALALRPTSAVALAGLADEVRGYVAASLAPVTRRDYATDWRPFTAWCDERGVSALPAAPATVPGSCGPPRRCRLRRRARSPRAPAHRRWWALPVPAEACHPSDVAARGRFRTVAAFRAVFANEDLRRVELAYLLFEMAKWGTRVAILVVAYERGGAAETGLVAVIQLVPAAIVAPLASIVGDRMRRDRALLLVYAVQTVTVGAVAAALHWGAPIGLVYTLAAVVAVSVTVTRPVQSALFPQLARTTDELVAENVVAGTISSAMALAGPVAYGAMVALDGPALALGTFAGLHLGATLLVVGLQPEPHPSRSGDRRLSEALAGFRELAHQPNERLVLGLLVGQSVISGVLEITLVVVALGLLGLPPSGAGFLSAARGAGGLLGGLWAARLVGRPQLGASLALGVVVYSLGTAAIAFAATALLTATSLVVAGAGHARADVAGRILLQRVVPDRILARVFGVLEGAKQAGAAVGAALTPLLVAVLGLRGGILAAGLLLPAVVVLLGARIRAVDRAVQLLDEEVALLRSLDLFAPLPGHMLEGIATHLIRVAATPGVVLIREGDPGDRFYIVAEGEVEISRGSRAMAKLGPGSSFGEVALLRNVPRTATVTASTPATLLALERVDFLEAITNRPRAVWPTIATPR